MKLLPGGLFDGAAIHAAVAAEHLTEWAAAGDFFKVNTAAGLPPSSLLLARLQPTVLPSCDRRPRRAVASPRRHVIDTDEATKPCPTHERMASRPGVERNIGHLMRRRHGGERALVLGRFKVAADACLLAAAVNLARFGLLAPTWDQAKVGSSPQLIPTRSDPGPIDTHRVTGSQRHETITPARSHRSFLAIQ